MRVPLLLVLLAGCLPPWPLGEPRPRPVDDDDTDDDDTGDDDTGDDDTGDDDTGDDDVADDDAADDDSADDDSADDDAADDDAGDDDTVAPADADGDGHSVGVDCDDMDPATFPGAPEVPCDEVDQDCDGSDLCSVCFHPGVTDLGTWTDNLGYWTGTLDAADPQYGDGPYRFETWRFVAGLTGRWDFDMAGVGLDAYLEVWDAGCNRVASDDDSGGQSWAHLQHWALAGDAFYVITTSAFPQETGDFELSLFVWGL